MSIFDNFVVFVMERGFPARQRIVYEEGLGHLSLLSFPTYISSILPLCTPDSKHSFHDQFEKVYMILSSSFRSVLLLSATLSQLGGAAPVQRDDLSNAQTAFNTLQNWYNETSGLVSGISTLLDHAFSFSKLSRLLTPNINYLIYVLPQIVLV